MNSNTANPLANYSASLPVSSDRNTFDAASNPLNSAIGSNSIFGRSSADNSFGDAGSLGGNIIIGNGEWKISEGFSQQGFASLARKTLNNLVSLVFDRLNEKYVSETGGKSISETWIPNQNPFADGGNPFGGGNLPEIPLLDFFRSRFGTNFPLPNQEASNSLQQNFPGGVNNIPFGGSPFAGGMSGGTGNPVASGTSGGTGNPVASGTSGGTGNPVAGGAIGDSNPVAGSNSGNIIASNPTEQSSLPSSSPLTNSNPSDGGGNPGSGGSGGNPVPGGSDTNPFAASSASESLSKVLDYVLDFSGRIDRMGTNSLFGGVSGNLSPLDTPDELLRLFRTDMTSFGLTVEAFTNFVGDNNPFAGTSNPFAGTNPFASGVDENTFAGANQRFFNFLGWALEGILPVSGTPNVFQTPQGGLPLGYGNRDFGAGNATIGNANRDYGNNNASIGNNNWNWDSSSGNATIGNGNWNWLEATNNKTVGNGNWHLDRSNDNNTFGNANWNIGSNNSTLGNGNFNFGNNNLVIGNGNWVFTSNSIVIGNGNWSVVLENTPTNVSNVSSILDKINSLVKGMEIKSVVDDMVQSTVKKMGSAFYGLTENFDESKKQTFDKVIRGKNTDTQQNQLAFSYKF